MQVHILRSLKERTVTWFRIRRQTFVGQINLSITNIRHQSGARQGFCVASCRERVTINGPTTITWNMWHRPRRIRIAQSYTPVQGGFSTVYAKRNRRRLRLCGNPMHLWVDPRARIRADEGDKEEGTLRDDEDRIKGGIEKTVEKRAKGH